MGLDEATPDAPSTAHDVNFSPRFASGYFPAHNYVIHGQESREHPVIPRLLYNRKPTGKLQETYETDPDVVIDSGNGCRPAVVWAKKRQRSRMFVRLHSPSV